MPADVPLPCSVYLVVSADETRRRLMSVLPEKDAHVSHLSSPAWDDSDLDQPPDLFIVDVRPNLASVATSVAHARRRWPSVGILCLYVGTNEAAVELLDAGADDALTSDTSWEIVAAHVAATLRRVQLANAQLRIAFGDLVYERESRRVWCAGPEGQLTPRQLRLFDILFLRARAPVSADTLYDYVWHDEGTRTSNSLAVYVGYLRRKLTGSRVAVLETLRGQGYRLSQRDE